MAKPKPNTPASTPVDPAPEQMQEHAGAGETQSPQSEPPARGPVVTHLIVRARTNGFRRCGRAWPDTETTVDVDDMDDADIERLLAEPELIVTAVAAGDPA